MRIYKSDSKENAAAKKGAMICEYSIHNPFHVSFEDGNFHRNWDLQFELRANERYRKENGDLMYEFIRSFIDDLMDMSSDERMQVYRLTRKKWAYLSNRWRRRILADSNPRAPGCGAAYKHYLSSDGHIYVETDKGIKIKQF